MNRRHFLKLAGIGAAASSLGMMQRSLAEQPNIPKARVLVIGGGYGGATAAKYIRRYDPSIAVTLIEQNKQFISCPFSNKVIADLTSLEKITFNYKALSEKYGVQVVYATAERVDATRKQVILADGKSLEYDFVIVSPGIELKWGALEGYDQAASELVPHAWKAGEQTLLLRKQLQAMSDGGVVYLSVPANPYRCPPGPYERASLIAHYLKEHKPKSKVVILDSKDSFSKQALFEEGWAKLYGKNVEWVGGSGDGKVVRVDAKNLTLHTDLSEHKGAVLNVIPPQQAGKVAQISGLADASGWCPVNQATFESKLVPNVYVIGDAAIAGKMPKSGYSANSQGKICAAAVVAKVWGESFSSPTHINTCYSLLSPQYGITIAGVYTVGAEGSLVEVAGSGGVSPTNATDQVRALEAVYADAWFSNITQETFG